MKKQWFCLLMILCISICLWGCQNNAEMPENKYVLDVQMTPTAEASLSGVSPSVQYTVSNSSLVPVLVREVLILSAYDAEGNPLTMDGSSYTPSSLDLSAQDDREMQKNISLHQATYVSEYTLDAASILKAGLFSKEDLVAINNTSDYTLSIVENSEFINAILRLDALLLGKPQEYPYADWEVLSTSSQLLQGSESPAAAQIAAEKMVLPNFTSSQSYQWELDHGNALLKGIGTVQETQIMIPASVFLSKTADGYMEDPIFGTVYNVAVAGDAFYCHGTLEAVTFADGVAVVDNAMYAGLGRGMFQNCPALTVVNNIPDTVISMRNTFAGCTAMECTPAFPASLQDMTNCFWRCSALTEVAPLPEDLVCMNSSFRECSSLSAIPTLPEGVKDITRCFYKCSSLSEVTSLPDSIVDMTGCFYHCSALTTVDAFPDSLKKVNACFQGCSNLQSVPALPEGVKDISSCFYNCTSLTKVPDLPDSITNMANAFSGCTGITEVTRWPANIENLYGCFTGCTNLASVPTIPNSVTGWAVTSYHLKETFWGCDTLDTVTIECCSNAIREKDTSDHAKVIFNVDHASQGVCEGCHYVNGTYEADGLTFRVVNSAPAFVDIITEWLETEVPDSLKRTCSSITFTPNWDIYGMPNAVGFARYPSGAVYIRCEDVATSWIVDVNDPETIENAARLELDWVRSIVYHELAHCYDTNFSTYHRFSTSPEFMRLFREEGDFWDYCLGDYPSYEHPLEVFARATSRYFCDPEGLLENCPGIYDYIDDLFGDET